MCVSAHSTVQVWTSEDNLWEPFLSFLCADRWNGTQVLELNGRCLYPLGHLTGLGCGGGETVSHCSPGLSQTHTMLASVSLASLMPGLQVCMYYSTWFGTILLEGGFIPVLPGV